MTLVLTLLLLTAAAAIVATAHRRSEHQFTDDQIDRIRRDHARRSDADA